MYTKFNYGRVYKSGILLGFNHISKFIYFDFKNKIATPKIHCKNDFIMAPVI